MEYRSKHNDKKHSLDVRIDFDDVNDIVQKASINNIKTELVRNDIIGEILEIFISMTISDNHVTAEGSKYNESTRETSVSFFFGRFMEEVVISWNQTVSLIEIKTYSFSQGWCVGNITILVNLNEPPRIENLMEDNGSTLSNILFKHLKRHLSQYKPKVK